MAIPRIIPVLTDDISETWPHLEPIIEKARKHAFGAWTLDHIQKELSLGHAQAFIVVDEKIIGVVVTTIQVYPARKALHLLIISGIRVHEWKHSMRDVAMRFAKGLECDCITGTGRRGWVRALSDIGVKEELVNYSLEVK